MDIPLVSVLKTFAAADANFNYNKSTTMRIEIRAVPYYKDTAPPEVTAIFRAVIDHLRKQPDLTLENRCFGLGIVRIVTNDSVLTYIVLSISGDDFYDNRLGNAVEDLLRDKRNSEEEDSPLWQSMQFAGFEAARRQDQRSMFTQGLPFSLASLPAQVLTDEDKEQLLSNAEGRLSELKTLLRSNLAGYLTNWQDAKFRFDDLEIDATQPMVPFCESFNFDYDNVNPEPANYWHTWLAVEPNSVRTATDRVAFFMDSDPPMSELTIDPEEFTVQEYLVAKKDYFANVIDWDEITSICHRNHISDLRSYIGDAAGFKAKFGHALTPEELTIVTDYLWRFRQFRHFICHALKKVKLSPDSICERLATISRLKLWCSRHWPTPSESIPGEDTTCCAANICDSDLLKHLLHERYKIEKSHFAMSREEFQETYAEQAELPPQLFNAAVCYLTLVEEAASIKLSDINELVHKVKASKISTSVLIPGRESEQKCDQMYATLRLYNIQDALRIEQGVRRFRAFYTKHEDIVVDSLYKACFDEALEAAAQYVGLWPPPPPYRNRVAAFFPHCAEDNGAPAIRSILTTTGQSGCCIENVEIAWYTVQPGKFGGGQQLIDRQLCAICRPRFIQRLKSAIEADMASFFPLSPPESTKADNEEDMALPEPTISQTISIASEINDDDDIVDDELD